MRRVCPAARTAGGVGDGPPVRVATATLPGTAVGTPTVRFCTAASPGFVTRRVRVTAWPTFATPDEVASAANIPAAPMVKSPEVTVPDETAAPELPSVPLAPAETRKIPDVGPATKVQVKVALAPAASRATDAGTGPVPGFNAARPGGASAGAVGTTSLRSAPPTVRDRHRHGELLADGDRPGGGKRGDEGGRAGDRHRRRAGGIGHRPRGRAGEDVGSPRPTGEGQRPRGGGEVGPGEGPGRACREGRDGAGNRAGGSAHRPRTRHRRCVWQHVRHRTRAGVLRP